MTQRIGVFCSARSGLPAAYVSAAEQLGQWIGTTGRMLVYGGVSRGLMEVVAQSVKQSGGRTMGIIPESMIRRGMLSDAVDVEVPCAALSDRKEYMMREADVFVALPGGIGTLDEVMTVLAAAQVGEHRKKVFFFNVDGVFNELFQLIQTLENQGLVEQGTGQSIGNFGQMDQLTAALEKI